MATVPAALWTLEELAAQVAVALAAGGPAQASGRVREVPDPRTIRFYTTTGLLDRPAELRGRTALYGRRHLLQLVAIKRLQAKGLALAEIQRQLYGLPDAALEKAAHLSRTERERERAPARRDFWRESAPIRQAVEIARGLELLIAAARPVEPDDLEALRAAAAPLLKVLARRNLLSLPPEEKP